MFIFFFFKQKTAYEMRISDWSSDVCSSDLLNVSPDVLRVIASQARVGTLHLYVPSPSRDYWGDLQRVRGGDPEAAAGENPLLRAWGAAGRDFMAVLGGYAVVPPDPAIRGDSDPGEVGRGPGRGRGGRK